MRRPATLAQLRHAFSIVYHHNGIAPRQRGRRPCGSHASLLFAAHVTFPARVRRGAFQPGAPPAHCAFKQQLARNQRLLANGPELRKAKSRRVKGRPLALLLRTPRTRIANYCTTVQRHTLLVTKVNKFLTSDKSVGFPLTGVTVSRWLILTASRS